MAPQVRELNALIAQQQESLKPQYGLLDESIATNENAGTAQIAGLGAAQTKAFKGIEQTAQNKGMFFSGFAPDEQAEYTASTYLPALAQVQQTIASARGQLLGDKAKLGKTAFDAAFNVQQQDREVLNRWNEMTAQQQFQASQDEKNRAFQAQQNEANRQHEAKIASQNRAAASSSAASSKAAQPTPKANAAAGLRAYVGDDGYVSPGTWGSVKAQWVGSGDGSAQQFDQLFAGFKNPNNPYYK